MTACRTRDGRTLAGEAEFLRTNLFKLVKEVEGLKTEIELLKKNAISASNNTKEYKLEEPEAKDEKLTRYFFSNEKNIYTIRLRVLRFSEHFQSWTIADLLINEPEYKSSVKFRNLTAKKLLDDYCFLNEIDYKRFNEMLTEYMFTSKENKFEDDPAVKAFYLAFIKKEDRDKQFLEMFEAVL
jgi:hypothetical protein